MSPSTRSGPGSPAGRTSAATPGSPRWPGPAGTPGNVGGSAGSAGSQLPGGCMQCDWHWSLGCPSHQISVQRPVDLKQELEKKKKKKNKSWKCLWVWPQGKTRARNTYFKGTWLCCSAHEHFSERCARSTHDLTDRKSPLRGSPELGTLLCI